MMVNWSAATLPPIGIFSFPRLNHVFGHLMVALLNSVPHGGKKWMVLLPYNRKIASLNPPFSS